MSVIMNNNNPMTNKNMIQIIIILSLSLYLPSGHQTWKKAKINKIVFIKIHNKQGEQIMPKFIFLSVIFLSTLSLAQNFPSASFIQPISDKEKNSKRIIGEANFEKIRDLASSKKLFNTSRRVAFLNINNQGSCTGSLVGPDLILTNAHCVLDAQMKNMNDVTKISINMEYLSKNQRSTVHAQVIRALRVNPGLDYALLQLDKKIGLHYGWLELAETTPSKGDVMIIQHPYGREKEISRIKSSIVKANTVVLHYYADTEPGSSGSPVFNLKGTKLIALHHAGSCAEESKNQQGQCEKFDFNEGIIIGRIKQEIKEFIPSCALDGDFPGKFVNKCVYLTE